MHTRASNSELVEPLSEPVRTLNRRRRRRNRRVPFENRNNPPQHPRVIYAPILDINYFRHFLDILRNYDPMDDELMWNTDRVVAPTPGSAITIHETANEFAIKGSSNSDTDKIMARMDAMTMKMDAQLADKQSGQPSRSLPSNTQPNPEGSLSKPYQPPQARNEHVNAVFTRSGKSYDPPDNPNDRNENEIPINFDSDDEDDEPTPQPKPKNPKQISAALLSNESSTILQNKVPPKLGDLRSFLIPCNFNKAFSCNALADLGASINLMPYSLYVKLSLETLKPTKMSVRLANRSFQYPVGIAKSMLVEVGKFTFLADFVILEMEEDSKVPLILGRPFLYTADAVILV
ncbi:reverse transcriptase domain-containing protein [Tanacetum coccineum]